jgi:hypothetical protein
MRALSLSASCLAALVAVSGCGGNDVDSEAETVDVGVSVEPGTVPMNLIDLSKVKFKYQIKGCKSGFTKKVATDFVQTESVKLFKGDSGCVAELVAIELNGKAYTDLVAKDGKTAVTIDTANLGQRATAAAAGISRSAISYYFYKSSADTQFVLKVPDQETFDTSKGSSIKFTFESIRSDIVEKKVQGVSVAQGLSVGALESPNMSLQEANLTWNSVADQKTAGGNTYYGGLLKASFDCDDASKVTTVGGKNFCRTPGLDNQDISKMTAVLVAGRASGNTSALTYDEAVAKFNAANAISAGVSGSKDANGRALFDNIPYYQDSALGGTSNAWLIVRMQDADTAGNKFESYTVFNVTFTNNSP